MSKGYIKNQADWIHFIVLGFLVLKIDGRKDSKRLSQSNGKYKWDDCQLWLGALGVMYFFYH